MAHTKKYYTAVILSAGDAIQDTPHLLFEAKFFTSIGIVVRVKYRGDIFSSLLLLDGLVVIALVERREIEFLVPD